MKNLYLLIPLLILASCGDKKVIEPAKPEPRAKHLVGEQFGGGVVVYVDDEQHGIIAASEDVSMYKNYSTISYNAPLTASVQVSNVPSGTYLTYVIVDLLHPYVGEVSLYLVAPNGQSITLSANNGGNGANYDETVFAAGTFQPPIKSGYAPFNMSYYSPEQPFANLNASPMNGVWKLIVKDNNPFNDGKLIKWYPEFNGTSFNWSSDPGTPWSPPSASPQYIGTDYGTSKENTEKIVAAYGRNEQYAARVCDELVLNGYDDWYLPTKTVLGLMYDQKSLLNFDAFYYWTCTEAYYSSSSAYSKGMNTGTETTTSKTAKRRIRPVREF